MHHVCPHANTFESFAESMNTTKDILRGTLPLNGKAGFRILVGSFRENQLARDLSSFELMTRQSRKDPNYVIDPDGVPKVKLRYPGIVESYEELRANYSRGLEAAYELGYTIVPLSFEDLITDTCDCVARTIKAVKLFDDLQNFTKCKAVATHISPAHTNQTLDSATNAEVASIVRSELLGTPYEWMLDLDAMDWPRRVQPRSPVPTWHVRELISRKGKTFLRLPNIAKPTE